MNRDAFTAYGFTALPADQSKLPPATTSPSPILIEALAPPSTALAKRIDAYAQAKLSQDTYRHSLRVYKYGRAIAQECFPQFNLVSGSTLDETWFLTALLHDIGTTDSHLTATRLSYEFWAGIHAIDILQHAETTGKGGEGEATIDQAESVAEAIIRHQDVQDKGSITLVTRLIHLGTLLDNIGAGQELIHKDTIDNVVKAHPRPGWSGCFKATVEKEKAYKPYAMVSRIEGFEEAIEENGKSGVTGQYD
ncbi:hypothetical protein I317_05330 [Kwoniella heveanensis CBS 569]|nr:hypothetical protein I317_05330 [Kwoniella heveanensis CBS 569]